VTNATTNDMPHSSRYEMVLKSITGNPDNLYQSYNLNAMKIIEMSEESELREEWHELRIITNEPAKVAEFAQLNSLQVVRMKKLV
jgi:hypothetical protein